MAGLPGRRIVGEQTPEVAMQGFITGKHVLRFGGTIIRDYGVGCWLRCLGAVLANRHTTFLAIACAVPARPRR